MNYDIKAVSKDFRSGGGAKQKSGGAILKCLANLKTEKFENLLQKSLILVKLLYSINMRNI